MQTSRILENRMLKVMFGSKNGKQKGLGDNYIVRSLMTFILFAKYCEIFKTIKNKVSGVYNISRMEERRNLHTKKFLAENFECFRNVVVIGGSS
jgi:hypothetical protein